VIAIDHSTEAEQAVTCEFGVGCCYSWLSGDDRDLLLNHQELSPLRFTDTSDLRHFGPKTFRHHVFGPEVSQIFALHQCRNVSDTSTLKCTRHFGPRTKRYLECHHCLKK